MRAIKKANYIYIWITLVVAMLFTATYWLYNNTKQNLYKATLQDHRQTIEHEISGIMKDRRESAMAIALALAESDQISDLLCTECNDNAQAKLNLRPFVEQLNLHTDYSQLWIQVIDAQGVSRYRSWTDRTGDSLKEVRRDVKRMIRTPAVQQKISVGRFSLTFKSMVPLFDDNLKLLGMVEVITHLTPMANSLKTSQGVESVILVDKRYRQQLTKAHTGMFLFDYYVANLNADSFGLGLLKEIGEDNLGKIEPVTVMHNQVVTQHLIDDDNGLILGYWYSFQSLDAFGFNEVDRLKQQYLYALLVISMLVLLLIALYLSKQRADRGHSYYRHILDSASEIIFVSNHQRIVEANQRFFEFYSEYENIDEFLKVYRCVCDTFIEAPGYLKPQMDGQFWLDYVLAKADISHKAQIEKDGEIHYFEVKVAQIDTYEKPYYSVIMHDITEEELYKQQLEVLSETDSLTGVANRLVFNRTLMQEIQRAHRYHSDLSLLLFDIDHFKQVNDNFGHDVGDQVLVCLSERIGELLRETDVLCRIGGEEFTVIMPETNIEQAQQTAERLRLAVENLPEESLPTPMTVSFGVAYMTRWDSDKTLFRRADDALYRAKEHGRNRVELALEHLEESDEKGKNTSQ